MKAPKALQAAMQKLRQKLRDRVSKLSRRRFVVLLAIFCCMLFAVVLFLMPAEKPKTVKNEQEEKPKVELVKVVTANRDIDPQTIIREDMLQTSELPKSLIPDGAVTDTKMAVNLPAAIPIQKGDVLTTKKFYSDVRMAGFPGKIPDDCRAVSVAISDITGISGFAKPGDHVDVIVILGKRGAKQMKGELLLQNVLLLGINKNAKVDRPTTTQTSSKDNKSSTKDGQEQTEEPKDKDKKKDKDNAEPGSQGSAQAMATATLAVNPNDALKLAVASQNGTIYLTLRPVVPKEGITLDKEYVYVDESKDDNEHDNYTPAHEPVSAAPTSTPAASVPLPPQSSAVTAQVPELPEQSFDPVANIEVIRGTESFKGNASSSSRASSRKNS